MFDFSLKKTVSGIFVQALPPSDGDSSLNQLRLDVCDAIRTRTSQSFSSCSGVPSLDVVISDTQSSVSKLAKGRWNMIPTLGNFRKDEIVSCTDNDADAAAILGLTLICVGIGGVAYMEPFSEKEVMVLADLFCYEAWTPDLLCAFCGSGSQHNPAANVFKARLEATDSSLLEPLLRVMFVDSSSMSSAFGKSLADGEFPMHCFFETALVKTLEVVKECKLSDFAQVKNLLRGDNFLGSTLSLCDRRVVGDRNGEYVQACTIHANPSSAIEALGLIQHTLGCNVGSLLNKLLTSLDHGCRIDLDAYAQQHGRLFKEDFLLKLLGNVFYPHGAGIDVLTKILGLIPYDELVQKVFDGRETSFFASLAPEKRELCLKVLCNLYELRDTDWSVIMEGYSPMPSDSLDSLVMISDDAVTAILQGGINGSGDTLTLQEHYSVCVSFRFVSGVAFGRGQLILAAFFDRVVQLGKLNDK